MPVITIYGPEQCPNCQRAIDLFTRKDIPYTKVTIAPGEETYRWVTDELGYTVAPVITVDIPGHDLIHWGGHRMDMLTALSMLCTKGIAPEADEPLDVLPDVPSNDRPAVLGASGALDPHERIEGTFQIRWEIDEQGLSPIMAVMSVWRMFFGHTLSQPTNQDACVFTVEHEGRQVEIDLSDEQYSDLFLAVLSR